MLRIIFVFCFFIIQQYIFCQDIFHEKIISFEAKDLSGWTAGKHSSIRRDPSVYKHGSYALRWDWKCGEHLTLHRHIGFEKADPTGKDTYLSTFVVWVYNEVPLNDHLSFQFGREERSDCGFDFNLNFKGWRAAWVCFERDMQGVPQKDMNRLTVVSPQKRPEGVLWFDHIILCTLSDSRYQTPDYQTPGVNVGTDSHWLKLLRYSKIRPDIPEKHQLSEKEMQDVRQIENRLAESFCDRNKQVDEAYFAKLRKKIDLYHIRIDKKGRISGVPLWFVRSTEVYERFTTDWFQYYAQTPKALINYFDLMLDVACAYHQTNSASYQKQLKEMFMQLYLHAEEQGIAAGSGLGTIHHSGYSFRNYYPALYLMRDVLAENGKLKDATQSMQWYAAIGEVLLKPETPGVDMDAFNTTMPGRLAGILMMADGQEKIIYLRSFVRWVNNGLLPSPGLMGAFKVDGAVMHHCNNYPAYGIGGIGGASLLTWLFSGTDFRFSESGHANLKKAMQTMRFYCNTKEWPVSISGRHPKGTEKLIPLYYAYMALAGTPDGKQNIDEEMACTYLRLTAYDKTPPEYRNRFQQEGFTPEETPQGNLTVNYGCLNIHRRAQWMAAAHGFSRYLWAAEHYVGANYYGRYLAHGSLFIQTGTPGELITNATSGYRQQGWDWNSIPGTTTTHLPWHLLKANILNVDTCSGYEEMLHSDEAFAGGLSQQQSNGIFAMKLHEHDKYNGALRARKSVFFLDDMIVCLGSDIENKSNEYPTRTTLYQTALKNRSEVSWKGNTAIEGFATGSFISTGDFLVNNVLTGYYIPKGQSVTLSRKLQHSRDQALDTPTEGLFAAAWIEHGNSPSGAGYEYAVFPETSPEKMQHVARQMSNRETSLYEVLRKDHDAHIVKSKSTQTVSYVLFEPDQSIADGIVAHINRPCLLMLKEAEAGYLLTVADPDLHLYEGASDDMYDETGKRIERSIYSRSWIANEGAPSTVLVSLRGKWNVRETEYCKMVRSDDDRTVISFVCKDGISRETVVYR